MEPITGLIIFLAELACLAAVAAKRGRRWWFYPMLAVPLAVSLVILSSAAGASSVKAGALFLLSPAVILAVLLASKTGAEMAATQGSYRGLRKCPHCAESIKAEAKVCKHCGRDVAPTA
jgi:hypothetical protein